MNEVRQESVTSSANESFHGVQTNQYQPLENSMEYIPDMQQETSKGEKDKVLPFAKRIKMGAGILFVAGIIAMVISVMSSTGISVDTSADAEEAIETHMSTTLTAGTKLMQEDDNYVGGDLTITHSSSDDETTLYVWDYAAEDGDYVQIFVNGTSLGDPFMIKNKPVSFIIPIVGEVKVVGTRDGGGGITYGVYYEVNRTTYFNGMSQGGDNTYTLIRE